MKNPYGIWKVIPFLWMGSITAAEELNPNRQSDQNIKITADSLECDQNKHVCIALGKALVEKLNDADKRTIYADRIEMVFEKGEEKSKEVKKSSSSSPKAKEFQAQGNVIVTIKESIIRGDKGTYTPETELVEVYENVSVTSGQNEILGNYGRANLKTGEYKVLNSKGRVTALVFQENTQEVIKKE